MAIILFHFSLITILLICEVQPNTKGKRKQTLEEPGSMLVSTHLNDIKLIFHLLCNICDGGGGVGVHVIEVVAPSTTTPSPTGCCLGHVVEVKL